MVRNGKENKLCKSFGKFICKHRKLILVIALLLIIPSIIGIKATRINYDILVYLPDDVETIGLFDIKDKNGNQIFNKDNLTELVNDVAGRYIDELETIEKDISKTNLL